MPKRFFVIVAALLSASVLCAAVAHACSDLSSMQAMLQMPCEHGQDEPLRKKEKNNCDFVRYGMLSTQASLSQADVIKLRPTVVHEALLVSIFLPDVFALTSRAQAPPLYGFGVSPRLSHVVLRI